MSEINKNNSSPENGEYVGRYEKRPDNPAASSGNPRPLKPLKPLKKAGTTSSASQTEKPRVRKPAENAQGTKPARPAGQTVRRTDAPVGKKKKKAVIRGLSKKTTYYVRVRYYDGVGYSAWSKVKKVKTK